MQINLKIIASAFATIMLATKALHHRVKYCF